MNFRALPPLIIALAIMPAAVQADVTVSFSASDGGRVFADEYGSGPRDVILAHGGRYDKESWRPQAHAFTTLAVEFSLFRQETFRGVAPDLYSYWFTAVLSFELI